MDSKFELAANYVKEKIVGRNPKIAIILGSGLGVLADEIQEAIRIPYKEIPNFPVSTVSGHAGELIIGKINGVAVKPNYLLPENVEFIVYDKRFAQKYEVWGVEPAINNLADGKHIGASALQGRQVGGLMVTNALGVQVKTNGESL